MSHSALDGIHGSHITVGDSHHTTIDLNPTFVDPSKGMVCGHGSVSMNLGNEHKFVPDVTASIGFDGCVTSNGHGGINMSGMNGIGDPVFTGSLGIHF